MLEFCKWKLNMALSCFVENGGLTHNKCPVQKNMVKFILKKKSLKKSMFKEYCLFFLICVVIPQNVDVGKRMKPGPIFLPPLRCHTTSAHCPTPPKLLRMACRCCRAGSQLRMFFQSSSIESLDIVSLM